MVTTAALPFAIEANLNVSTWYLFACSLTAIPKASLRTKPRIAYAKLYTGFLHFQYRNSLNRTCCGRMHTDPPAKISSRSLPTRSCHVHHRLHGDVLLTERRPAFLRSILLAPHHMAGRMFLPIMHRHSSQPAQLSCIRTSHIGGKKESLNRLARLACEAMRRGFSAPRPSCAVCKAVYCRLPCFPRP